MMALKPFAMTRLRSPPFEKSSAPCLKFKHFKHLTFSEFRRMFIVRQWQTSPLNCEMAFRKRHCQRMNPRKRTNGESIWQASSGRRALDGSKSLSVKSKAWSNLLKTPDSKRYQVAWVISGAKQCLAKWAPHYGTSSTVLTHAAARRLAKTSEPPSTHTKRH